MAFGIKLLRVVEATLACAATATMMYFGNGLNPVWPLMWVAPLPVLWFATRRGRWSAALVAGIASLAGALTFWEYFRVLGLPAVAWLGPFRCGSGWYLLSRLSYFARCCCGNRATSAVLAFPAAWVTFEYVRNLLWPHGSARFASLFPAALLALFAACFSHGTVGDDVCADAFSGRLSGRMAPAKRGSKGRVACSCLLSVLWAPC